MSRYAVNPPPLIQAIVAAKKGGNDITNLVYTQGEDGEKGKAFGDLRGWGQVSQDPYDNAATFRAFRPDIKGKEVRHTVLPLVRYDPYAARLEAWRTGVPRHLWATPADDYNPEYEELYARLDGIKNESDFRAVGDDLLVENAPRLADEMGARSPWIGVIHPVTKSHHVHIVQSSYDPETGKCLDIGPADLRRLQSMKWAWGLAPGRDIERKRNLPPPPPPPPGGPGGRGMVREVVPDRTPATGEVVPAPVRADRLAASKTNLQAKHDANLVSLAALLRAESPEALASSGRLRVVAHHKNGKQKTNPTLQVDGIKFRFDRLAGSGLSELSQPERFLNIGKPAAKSSPITSEGGDGGATELQGLPGEVRRKPVAEEERTLGETPDERASRIRREREKARREADAKADKKPAEAAPKPAAEAPQGHGIPLKPMAPAPLRKGPPKREIASNFRELRRMLKKAKTIKGTLGKVNTVRQILTPDGKTSVADRAAIAAVKSVASGIAWKTAAAYVPGLGVVVTVMSVASWLKNEGNAPLAKELRRDDDAPDQDRPKAPKPPRQSGPEREI